MKKTHKAILASAVLFVLIGLTVGNVIKVKSEEQASKPIPFDIEVFDENYRNLAEQYEDVYKFENVYNYADISRKYGEDLVTPLSAFYNDDGEVDLIVFEGDKPNINQLDLIYKSLELEDTNDYRELIEEIKTWKKPDKYNVSGIDNKGISINVSYLKDFVIMVSAD